MRKCEIYSNKQFVLTIISRLLLDSSCCIVTQPPTTTTHICLNATTKAEQNRNFNGFYGPWSWLFFVAFFLSYVLILRRSTHIAHRRQRSLMLNDNAKHISAKKIDIVMRYRAELEFDLHNISTYMLTIFIIHNFFIALTQRISRIKSTWKTYEYLFWRSNESSLSQSTCALPMRPKRSNMLEHYFFFFHVVAAPQRRL